MAESSPWGQAFWSELRRPVLGPKMIMCPTETVEIRDVNVPDCLDIYFDFSEILTVSRGILIRKFEKQIENKLLQDGSTKCEKLFSGKSIYRLLLEEKCKG